MPKCAIDAIMILIGGLEANQAYNNTLVLCAALRRLGLVENAVLSRCSLPILLDGAYVLGYAAHTLCAHANPLVQRS